MGLEQKGCLEGNRKQDEKKGSDKGKSVRRRCQQTTPQYIHISSPMMSVTVPLAVPVEVLIGPAIWVWYASPRANLIPCQLVTCWAEV